MSKIVEVKENYYKIINNRSKDLVYDINSSNFSEDLLKIISELYSAANTEKKFFPKNRCAYHQSVCNDFEFLIAKILDNYSIENKLNWEIYLRRQFKPEEKQLVPDIRIEKNGRTIAIFEIKAKCGWSQYLFSDKRRKNDQIAYDPKKSNTNPSKIIKDQKDRVNNLSSGFKVSKKNIFFVLPSLEGVFKPKKQEKRPKEYVNTFCRNMDVPRKNLILLSENPNLKLDQSLKDQELKPRDEFKEVIKRLK